MKEKRTNTLVSEKSGRKLWSQHRTQDMPQKGVWGAGVWDLRLETGPGGMAAEGLVVSRYVPLIMANSISWRFFKSSSPSGCSIPTKGRKEEEEEQQKKTQDGCRLTKTSSWHWLATWILSLVDRITYEGRTGGPWVWVSDRDTFRSRWPAPSAAFSSTHPPLRAVGQGQSQTHQHMLHHNGAYGKGQSQTHQHTLHNNCQTNFANW